jgi:hypothetical protein
LKDYDKKINEQIDKQLIGIEPNIYDQMIKHGIIGKGERYDG